ncbi:MAG: hypothetical protein WCJ18_12500 [Planctomycetota bacterium]
MIRKYAIPVLAMLAMGFLVAAPAEAGGTSGAVGVKKNANVIIKNTTATKYYVLVVPDSLASSTKFGTPGTVGWAKKLGAALVNPGATLTYPVPAGAGEIDIFSAVAVPADQSALLPPYSAFGLYTVSKGKNVNKKIVTGPAIQ